MTAYYNENNLAAAAILKEQIRTGVIAPGVVDTRSIKDVQPDDLIGFTQCHFFAGGGLWSVAARIAGWPDHEPIWTASCPCQPFSAAGKGAGTDDPRHLWPDLYRLKRARRPAVTMGEQVAGAAGYGWFDGVRADLAREGFSARAIDFPACSVDAPHQRNRQYWAAVDMVNAPSDGWGEGWTEYELRGWWPTPASADASGLLGDGEIIGRGPGFRKAEPIGHRNIVTDGVGSCPACGGSGRMGPFFPGGLSTICGNCVLPDATSQGRLPSPHPGIHRQAQGERSWDGQLERSTRPVGRNGTYWSDADWIECHDGKARRAKSDIRFLVNGLPGRVDLWRVGGNAIVPEAAAEVIGAFIDVYGLPSEWREAA
ncbi:DNA cytosine methyltransferase [Rhizobium laguerreae]|uniref:DNA cytosine methyltransferase n=1 Tax=Rhizobium laguerreae TaxID=1076926 RepID=UPI0028AF8E2F|nr:DNA cytosine methyltransferase [Rhizobium laguerreae]